MDKERFDKLIESIRHKASDRGGWVLTDDINELLGDAESTSRARPCLRQAPGNADRVLRLPGGSRPPPRHAPPQGEEEGGVGQEGRALEHQVRRPGAHVPARDGQGAAADPPGRGQAGSPHGGRPRPRPAGHAPLASRHEGTAPLRQPAGGRGHAAREGGAARQQQLEHRASRPGARASASCAGSTASRSGARRSPSSEPS